MSIFENEQHLHPDYDRLDKYCDMAYSSFWTPAKYKRGIEKTDVPNIVNKLPKKDRNAIERCILAILLVEDRVKLYWPSIYRDFPQTIVSDVGCLFGQQEITHRKSYASLGECLGVDVTQISEHKQLNSRIKYLNKYLEEDPKIIGDKRKLKRLVLFTSLVERCSLFTQFYILMSWCKQNKGLKTLSSLQTQTMTEELCHYRFGLELIAIVKKQKPTVWDDYLVDLINKNIKMAHKAELKMIDWFFEKGVPDHLSKEEVINFLNMNFQRVSDDLELGLKFKYDQEMYEKKNSWCLAKCYSQEADFFDAPVGGYNLDNEDVDLEEMFN